MKNVLSLENLSYSVPYGNTILEKVNLKVPEGMFLGILGHNGTGKTTLLDVLMGFKEAKGVVQVLGENPHSLNRSKKHKVVFLSQDIGLKGNLSIGEFLRFHSAFYADYSKEEESHLLKVFQLSREAKIGSLSLGQQKKVQIVGGLSTLPELLMIDEITAVLDPETRDLFFKEIERMRAQYKTAIVLATNIAEDLIDRADKVLFIEKKSAVLHDPKDIVHLFNLGNAA